MRLTPIVSKWLVLCFVLSLVAACEKPADKEDKEEATAESSEGEGAVKEGEAKEGAAAVNEEAKAPMLGDGPTEAKEPMLDEGPVDTVAVAPAATAERAPVVPLTEVSAMQHIPARAKAVVGTTSLLQLLDDLGRSEIQAKYAAEYAMMVAQATEKLGSNLLDPAEMSKIGLNVAGPAGLAFLDFEKEVFVVYASITDGTALKNFALATAEKNGATLSERESGGNVVITSEKKDRVAMIIMDQWVFMVFSNNSSEDMVVVDEIATLTADKSLTSNSEFMKGAAALSQGQHLAGWVDVRDFVKAELGKTDNNWAQFELDRARGEGNADDIAFWEKEVARVAGRQASEKQMLESLLGGITFVAFGLDAANGSLLFELEEGLVPDSKIRSLLKNTDHAPLIVRATKEKPIFLFGANVDVPSYKALMAGMMATEGESYEEMRAEVQKELDIDIDALLATVSGEFGMAVTGELDFNADNPAKTLGGNIVVALSDTAPFRAMLDKLSTHPMISKVLQKDGENYVAVIPEWQTVHITVANGLLTASTDKEFAARCVEPTTSYADALPAARKQLLASSGSAGVFEMDSSFIGGFFLARKASEARPMMSPPQDDPEMAKKVAQVEEIQKKIDELEKQEEETSNKRLAEMMKLVGVTTVVVANSEAGFEVKGGQFGGGTSNAEVILAFIDMGMTSAKHDSAMAQQMSTLYQERAKVEEELLQVGDRMEAPKPVTP
ncbi:MAG: hypothetical protein AUK47_12980 [Deltaproteobacteria bacterium CG2_30_63_29]|nr:MAG: hypothetical protein AUK47_12980 [Deltaproteobacteria bacterium CG2_30_63_29]PIV98110.1 MAG: hypothetical protein COW42_16540 [Deltaproteobacteria bacterium CG17_big_fil_post_rev_8_21_14_2_50_63_7]